VKVAINYCRNEVAANDVLGKVRGLGSDGFILRGDVCRPEDIVGMFRKARQEFGALDIFVANARPEVSTFYQPPMEITLESWQTAVDSQARAFLVGAREASPLFRNGGRIIAITYAPGGHFGSWWPKRDSPFLKKPKPDPTHLLRFLFAELDTRNLRGRRFLAPLIGETRRRIARDRPAMAEPCSIE
jgi:NAD(P)-dependent dehydrogenase (short-subunit alcohol dehydrogenase family)